MTTDTIKTEQVLQKLEKELALRLEKLSTDMAQSHSADWAEQAVERENDEVIEQLRDDTNTELIQVRQALKRVEEGSYHQCARCGEDISAKRLDALPYTTLCIVCADQASA